MMPAGQNDSRRRRGSKLGYVNSLVKTAPSHRSCNLLLKAPWNETDAATGWSREISMMFREITPDEILEFWFPDGPQPEPEKHLDLWTWRMRGGAHDAIVERYSEITKRAAEGHLDTWAETSRGRLALIILLDQFSRSVWAGTPKAFAQDPKALNLCLQGFDNGHFDALENVWQKSVFKLPLEHCECSEHLANLDRAVAIARQIAEEAPEYLRSIYEMGAQQPVRHRAVIAEFGRHPHRNATLGRDSTPGEETYLNEGAFPHQADFKALVKSFL